MVPICRLLKFVATIGMTSTSQYTLKSLKLAFMLIMCMVHSYSPTRRQQKAKEILAQITSPKILMSN